jgi:hypothetical protein
MDFTHQYSGKQGRVIQVGTDIKLPDISVSLGDERLSERVSDLLRTLAQGRDAFLVEWSGSRIPRGAVIKGQEIAWTQHGVVRSTESKVIGYYERIVDDLSQDTQVMVIFA